LAPRRAPLWPIDANEDGDDARAGDPLQGLEPRQLALDAVHAAVILGHLLGGLLRDGRAGGGFHQRVVKLAEAERHYLLHQPPSRDPSVVRSGWT
jgi:hypothetical protein